MIKIKTKEVIENLIDVFFYAGKISLELRVKGLIKKIKSDYVQDHHCDKQEKGSAFNSAHNFHKGLTNVIMDKAGAMPLSFLRKTCARTQ